MIAKFLPVNSSQKIITNFFFESLRIIFTTLQIWKVIQVLYIHALIKEKVGFDRFKFKKNYKKIPFGTRSFTDYLSIIVKISRIFIGLQNNLYLNIQGHQLASPISIELQCVTSTELFGMSQICQN